MSGMREVVQKATVELALPCFCRPMASIQVGLGLGRQHTVEKMHHGRRGSGFDHEIGARETEQVGDVVAIHQQGIDVNAALSLFRIGITNGMTSAPLIARPTIYAAFVAIERRTQHLQMKMPAQLQPRHAAS